jgi:hypothetical protein
VAAADLGIFLINRKNSLLRFSTLPGVSIPATGSGWPHFEASVPHPGSERSTKNCAAMRLETMVWPPLAVPASLLPI